jgi:hypothetical protein
MLFALAFLVGVSAWRSGADPLRFTVTLDTLWNIGDTRYLMEEPATPPYGGSSELIFPLNTLVEGVRLRYEPASRTRKHWSLEGSFYTNLINPIGLMKDYDWWMYSGSPKVPFSYTESSAVMRWYLASLETQFELGSGGWGKFLLAFGYRFQFIKQVIVGFKGWTLDDNLDGVLEPYTPVQDSRHGLDYQIIYNIVTAGLAPILTPIPEISVTAEAGLALAYVSDRDDHVLRYKLSTASGLGYGGYAGLEVRYTWDTANPRLRPFIALSGSALGLRVKTSQTQTYYQGATEAPPGTTMTGIDHRISTRQYRAAFILGLQF